MQPSSSQPSQFLPPLTAPLPLRSDLASTLSQLSTLLNPKVIIDLTGGRGAEADADENAGLDDDEFEQQFTRGWLGRLVAVGTKQIGSSAADEQGEEVVGWEELVEEAAGLLASMSGHCAAGPTTKTFLLPAPPSSTISPSSSLNTTSPPATTLHKLPFDKLPIELIITETTLLESSTGFRTWSSAPLLSKLIATSPSSFFPSSPSSTFKVLELGSGTGLVGFTASAVLRRLGYTNVSIGLTDWEPPVFHNLGFNLLTNYAALLATTRVDHLDWSSFPRSPTEEQHERYDIILGADLVYEPTHLPWIIATVSALLQFPDSTSEVSEPCFHLVIPIRHTHSSENDEFDRLFRDGILNENGWRLVTKEKTELVGEDGFGADAGRSEVRHWYYKIGWNR